MIHFSGLPGLLRKTIIHHRDAEFTEAIFYSLFSATSAPARRQAGGPPRCNFRFLAPK